jgi:diadenosine tetraphosphatase ApaH/serine/threonine PP2A family protein phosphatase
MRIAVVSDIHANWPALQAILEDLEGVDDVICLGDVVGYGGQPLPCLDHVSGQGWLTLVGNHDRACTDAEALLWFNADAAAAVRWTAAQLDPGRARWLGGLPERATRDDVLLVHGSPRGPVHEYVLDQFTAAANLELLDGGVCFHGHTHLPGVFHVEHGSVVHDYRLGPVPLTGPALVNPGSVGQPRDRNPDASYGIWDTEAGSFDFRRVPYDREAAKRAILEAGLPPRFASRLDVGY